MIARGSQMESGREFRARPLCDLPFVDGRTLNRSAISGPEPSLSDFLGKPGVTAQYKVAASDTAVSPLPSRARPVLLPANLATTNCSPCCRKLFPATTGRLRSAFPAWSREYPRGRPHRGPLARPGLGLPPWWLASTAGSSRDTRRWSTHQIVGFLEHGAALSRTWSHTWTEAGEKHARVWHVRQRWRLVNTSFLMQGLLAARQYFHGKTETEQDLYRRVTQLWESVEWDLVPWLDNQRLLFMALVSTMGPANSSSSHWIQRSHDLLSACDVVANAWRAC